MIVKVCGMREADNIRAVEKLGIDYMGFIFWPKSSRYVETPPAYLPTNCKRVGVFVNSDTNDVQQHVAEYHLSAIQLHGTESPEYINKLRNSVNMNDLVIIKAISIHCSNDIAVTKDYNGLVDYFLFDTKCQSVGGSGRQFDWSFLMSYDSNTPFLLSGGIGPDDVTHIKAFKHPQLAGIDLNSRFESAPALKDITKLKTFLQAL